MPRYNAVLAGASAGLVSPRFEGRDNLQQYAESLRRSENFLITLQGGLLRRSGTRFLAPASTATGRVRLIPFTFSVGQSYVIEFTNLTARFYVPGGRLDSPPGTPVELVTPYTDAQVERLQTAQIGNILYIAHPSHPLRKLVRTSPTAFALQTVPWRRGRSPMLPDNVEPTTFTVSGSGPNYTLTSSVGIFTASDVGRYVRMSDNTDQRWFEITAVSSGTVATVQVRDGNVAAPFTASVDDWSMSPQSNTIGFSAVAFHAGRLWLGGTSRALDRVWCSNSDDFEFFEPRAADIADLQAEQSNRGFSRRMTSGELNDIQWLISTSEALMVGTAGGEFFVEPTGDSVLASTTVDVTPATQRGVSAVSPRVIDGDVFYTQREGRKLRRASYSLAQDRYASADLSLLAEDITRTGVRQIAYQQAPESTLWGCNMNGDVWALTTDKEQNLIAFHRHILGGVFLAGRPQVVSLAVARGPQDDRLFLAVRRTVDGAVVTYIEELDPVFDPPLDKQSSDEDRSAATDRAFFVDSGLTLDEPIFATGVSLAAPAVVTAAGHGLTTGDRVWVRELVTPLGLSRRRFAVTVLDADTFSLDGSDTVGGTAYIAGGEFHKEVGAVTGLGHLEGEIVAILADGAERPTQMVVDGGVTLDPPAALVSVGLPMASIAETQRMVGGEPAGTAQGSPARVHRVSVRLLNTLGLTIRVGAATDTVEFRQQDDFMDENLPLFSGDVEVSVEAGWNSEPSVTLIQAAPLPAHILAVYPRAVSNGR